MGYETAVEMRVAINGALSSKVEKYRPARLVVRSLNIVALFVGILVVRCIARIVGEMVNLGRLVV
jgi:hypothetical protein